MPVLGAHVDSSGGLHLAFERAKAMGAESIQIHPTPPGFWGSPKLDENRIATFKEAAAKHGHPPFYFHAVYLINLAGDDPTLRQRSESTLAGYLKAADELGVNGVIFHTGSHKGAGFDARLPSITEHLQHVLERASPKSARLLIENNAGLGGCVGGVAARGATGCGGRGSSRGRTAGASAARPPPNPCWRRRSGRRCILHCGAVAAGLGLASPLRGFPSPLKVLSRYSSTAFSV